MIRKTFCLSWMATETAWRKWDNPYLTMDFKNEAGVVRALGQMIKNGHVYKGTRPVYWSVGARSALAEAEVEYEDKTSASASAERAPTLQ